MGGEDGFPNFDQQAHGLIQVVAEERGGLLLVTQKQPLSAGALGDLPDLIAPSWKIFEYSSFANDANWNVLQKVSMYCPCRLTPNH